MKTYELLIQEAAIKNEIAFEKLVKRYDNQILNLAYKYVNNFAVAEELAQDIFLKVWKYAKNFKNKSKFSTWLYRIAINECLNNIKKKKTVIIEFDENILTQKTNQPDLNNQANQLERQITDEFIRNEIGKLTQNQKNALILSQFENKSYKEISEILEVSVSAVESLIYRAKQTLKKYIKKNKI